MAKKLKIPKTIAGVKVPKQLRGKKKTHEKELAAAALIAVAGTLLSSKKVRKSLADTSIKVAKSGRKAAGKARDEAKKAAEKIAARVSKMATKTQARPVRPVAARAAPAVKKA
ncbi:MAG TPA: hypothetical protein VG735_13930 [Caulobacterales bacterium]|nr:hypothetical protein [Caulobacterales bacterium]